MESRIAPIKQRAFRNHSVSFVCPSLVVEERVLGILLLLLHPEVVSGTKDDQNKKDNAEDLATVALGLAGLKLGLERLNLFAAALVSGVTAVGGVLDELRAHVLGLELSVIVVGGALGGHLVKSKTGAVRDLLAGELVVGGCGLSGAGFFGEEIKLCVRMWGMEKREMRDDQLEFVVAKPPHKQPQ